jgi:hypothetical protein
LPRGAAAVRTPSRSSTKLAWILTGGLSLMVGGVLFFVFRTKAQQAAPMREVDPDHHPWEKPIPRFIQTRGLKEKLNSIETQLDGSPTLEILGKLYADVRSSELTSQASDASGEFKSRHDRLTKAVCKAYIDNLRAAATAASSATTGEALAPFGTLEDVLRTVRDDAILANDLETQGLYTPMWKQVCSEINGITSRMFVEAYRDKIAWTDLLADPSGWVPGNPPASFKFEFGGGLTMTNAPNGATGGLAYFPKADDWRDYVIDLELKLDSGSFAFYVRIGDKMDAKECLAFDASTQVPRDGVNVLLESGGAHRMQVSVIGTQLLVWLDGALVFVEEDDGNTKSRKGEPGIAVRTGTKLTITRLKVRHLR